VDGVFVDVVIGMDVLELPLEVDASAMLEGRARPDAIVGAGDCGNILCTL
jgi:hypothetical protein